VRPHPFDQELATFVVEADRRLVEQEQLGRTERRAREREPLPLSEREGGEPRVGARTDTEALDRCVDLGLRGALQRSDEIDPIVEEHRVGEHRGRRCITQI
jgi:hypothetical protein